MLLRLLLWLITRNRELTWVAPLLQVAWLCITKHDHWLHVRACYPNSQRLHKMRISPSGILIRELAQESRHNSNRVGGYLCRTRLRKHV